METLQDFLDTVPDGEHRATLERVIKWVADTFQDVTVEIKWNQPVITLDGTFIIGFSASQQHFAVAPERQILDEFCEQLDAAGYSQSKALFRIRWTQDVNYELLEDMIERSIEFKAGSTTFWAS